MALSDSGSIKSSDFLVRPVTARVQNLFISRKAPLQVSEQDEFDFQHTAQSVKESHCLGCDKKLELSEQRFVKVQQSARPKGPYCLGCAGDLFTHVAKEDILTPKLR